MKGSILRNLGLLLLLGALTHCSQSRNSLYAGQKTEELWTPQSLCSVEIASFSRMGCFSVQLSITRNIAYFDVQELLFDPGVVPYRILARRSGESQWIPMLDNVTIGMGGTVEVSAKNGAFIEEYEAWRVELSQGQDALGLNMINVPMGQGRPVVQAVLNWPELAQITN